LYFFNNKHTHSNYNTTLNTTYNIKLAFFNAILFTDETFALHVLTALKLCLHILCLPHTCTYYLHDIYTSTCTTNWTIHTLQYNYINYITVGLFTMHSNQNSLFIQDIVLVSTIIIHWTHYMYLFSDWLKAYSEFSLIISRKLQPITVYYWHGYYYPIYVVSFWGCALENQVPQTTTGNFCLWVTGKKKLTFFIWMEVLGTHDFMATKLWAPQNSS